MSRIYCQDLVNRTKEITPEEVESQLKSHSKATKMFAALLSLVDLNSKELDLDDWECELGRVLGFGVIDVVD